MRKSIYQRGSFHLELCFDKVNGELEAEDRQCAWELYTEMVTRGAVCGYVDRDGGKEDELLIAGLASMREFLVETRKIMRRYPVGRVKSSAPHLGSLIGGMLQVSVQPFLEHWDGRFSAWWQAQPKDGPNLFVVQRRYPHIDALLEEWRCLRELCRSIIEALEATYGFRPPLLTLVPQHVRAEWV